MRPQLSSSQVQQLKQDVFTAAVDGRPHCIKHLLTGLNLDLIKQVLHHHSVIGSRRETPLTIAVQCGHLKVVQLLVEHFHVQCDQKTLSHESLCDDTTALMHAACKGNLDIVKCLVNSGSDFNLRNQFGETPLFFACINTHLEVVKYLVESGSQIEEVDALGNSCLMMACRTGSEQMVRYLLEKGADVNKKDCIDTTPLHVATSKNSFFIVELLLKNGARFSKDREGHTPLTIAFNHCSVDAVRLFAESSYVAWKEKIDALELLGALKAETDLNETFRHLRQAMVMRYKNPDDVLSKPHSPLPTLSGAVESRTLEELEARKFDHDILRLECLAIVQRICGCKNKYVFNSFYAYFMDLICIGRHHEGLSILVYAVKNVLDCQRGWDMFHLECFPFEFRDMLQNGQSPCFSTVLEVLDLTLTAMQQEDIWRPMSKDALVNISLQCIMVGLKVAQGQDEGKLLKERTECLIHLRPSLCQGRSVLHKAVASCWSIYWELNSVPDLPYDLLVSFFIQCGADVNAGDDQRNRSLHDIAQWYAEEADSEVVCRITRILVQAGALVGVQNSQGETPLDVAATEAVTAILREHFPVSLKSLAASAVVRHQIPYAGEIPRDLEEFVQYH